MILAETIGRGPTWAEMTVDRAISSENTLTWYMWFSSRSERRWVGQSGMHANAGRSVLERIVYECCEAITQQKPLPVRFRFGDQGQQNVAVFGQNLLNAENLQGLGHVKDLGDRGRFLKAPSPKRLRQSGNLVVNGTLTASLYGD